MIRIIRHAGIMKFAPAKRVVFAAFILHLHHVFWSYLCTVLTSAHVFAAQEEGSGGNKRNACDGSDDDAGYSAAREGRRRCRRYCCFYSKATSVSHLYYRNFVAIENGDFIPAVVCGKVVVCDKVVVADEVVFCDMGLEAVLLEVVLVAKKAD